MIYFLYNKLNSDNAKRIHLHHNAIHLTNEINSLEGHSILQFNPTVHFFYVRI